MVTSRLAPAVDTSTVDERRSAGKAARAAAPRSSFGEWSPPDGDATSILFAQEATRLPDLVPLRHERMNASPFAFFRGAAAVFSADVAALPRSGITVQLCGDAHLANFGTYASPERELIFDANDFDETLPGPFEWDLLRLVASFEVAARDRDFPEGTGADAVKAVTTAYLDGIRACAEGDDLTNRYSKVTTGVILDQFGDHVTEPMLANFDRHVRKAESKDRLRALSRLTDGKGDALRFRRDAPLLVPAADLFSDIDHDTFVATITHGLDLYRSSLPDDRRYLLEHYRFVDLARKVVGVGSVGTRCWVILLLGRAGDPLFLQVKQAESSVLEGHLGSSTYDQHGRRVVEGQRLMQSASDAFLGWMRLHSPDGQTFDYYVRQLWDWKGSADVERMDPEMLTMYGRLCGFTLARAHARSGDPVAIAAYIGKGHTLGASLARFASLYADKNAADHAAFTAATGA